VSCALPSRPARVLESTTNPETTESSSPISRQGGKWRDFFLAFAGADRPREPDLQVKNSQVWRCTRVHAPGGQALPQTFARLRGLDAKSELAKLYENVFPTAHRAGDEFALMSGPRVSTKEVIDAAAQALASCRSNRGRHRRPLHSVDPLYLS